MKQTISNERILFLSAAPVVLNHITKHRAQIQANKRLPTRSKLRDSTIQEYHV